MEKLEEKLENLSEKFENDLDIIALKALCQLEKDREVLFSINKVLKRLKKRYPEEEEILNLFPKKEKIILDELIVKLNQNYLKNSEIVIINALKSMPDSEKKELAIKAGLERLIKINPNDEDILSYLGIEKNQEEIDSKEMIFVKGGKYKPAFLNEERAVWSMEVSKYLVTQEKYEEIMQENPSHFKGKKLPVECVTWIEALKFCNALSEKEGLEPVYKIENDNIYNFTLKINQLSSGKSVYPNLADFRDTEGYRLPTEIEWEWFTRGGEVAIRNSVFTTEYAGNNYIEDVAWYSKNSNGTTHPVGLKAPNILGIYDCTGNVSEWCYDTTKKGNISKEKQVSSERPYMYNSEVRYRRVKGGSWYSDAYHCEISSHFRHELFYKHYNIGFRVVRSI